LLGEVLRTTGVAFKRLPGPLGPRVVEVHRQGQVLTVRLHALPRAGWRDAIITHVPCKTVVATFGQEGWSGERPSLPGPEAVAQPEERTF